jgi:carboxylate-amine ligase
MTTILQSVLSFGVEEEFVLVDPVTRRTVPRAPEVIKLASEHLDERVQSEFFATQIEFISRPHQDAAGLRQDLARGRRILCDAAERSGCRLAAAASAVLSPDPLPIADSTRYRLLARRFEAVVAGMDSESSGCHIHVGTLDAATALRAAGLLRPWLPTLQALAVNSPFAASRDHGCCSWRHFESLLWPTMGPPPVLELDGYERRVRMLEDRGTILDRKMIDWYARPSEHVPTVEVRVLDVNPDIDVTVFLAIALRGLVAALLSEDEGSPALAPVTEDQVLAAHESAARAGLDAWGLDGRTGAEVPMRQSVESLLEYIGPQVEKLGDAGELRVLAAALAARGTGADRQRADFERRHSLVDVVDGIVERTCGAAGFSGR